VCTQCAGRRTACICHEAEYSIVFARSATRSFPHLGGPFDHSPTWQSAAAVRRTYDEVWALLRRGVSRWLPKLLEMERADSSDDCRCCEFCKKPGLHYCAACINLRVASQRSKIAAVHRDLEVARPVVQTLSVNEPLMSRHKSASQVLREQLHVRLTERKRRPSQNEQVVSLSPRIRKRWSFMTTTHSL
jgi:hypothetical protein